MSTLVLVVNLNQRPIWPLRSQVMYAKPKTTAAIATLIAALIVVVLLATSPGTPAQAGYHAVLGGTPSALAGQDIPANYLTWYIATAQACPGLPWSSLAGIGKVESNHGRPRLPGVRSASNSAGTEGPMQFLPATFVRYAVNSGPSQPLTPYDPGRRDLHRCPDALRQQSAGQQCGSRANRLRVESAAIIAAVKDADYPHHSRRGPLAHGLE